MEPGSSRPGPRPNGRRAGSPGGARDVIVLLAAPGWRAAVKRPEQLVRRAAAVALEQSGARGGMTVLLTDDAHIKRLNHLHRAKAKPTNVLSFPAEAAGYLGDVALAFGVVRREAKAAGRRIEDHLAHLIVHGALHLVGHDHLAAGEARRMERAEARVLRRLGRANPWKEGRAQMARGRQQA